MSASERLKRLDEGAACGPWIRVTAANAPGDGPVIKNEDNFDWVATIQVSNVPNWRENAMLIATLRNALPELVAVVEVAERPDSIRLSRRPVQELSEAVALKLALEDLGTKLKAGE